MKQLEKDNTLIQLVITNLWHYLDNAKERVSAEQLHFITLLKKYILECCKSMY